MLSACFTPAMAAVARFPPTRTPWCRPVCRTSGPSPIRRRTLELPLLGTVLAPSPALADGSSAAAAAGPPDGSASAAVASVIRAYQEGTADVDEPVPGLDEALGGSDGGRRAARTEGALVAEASMEGEGVDSESDSNSESDSDSSSSSSSSDDEGMAGRRRAATRRRKGEAPAAGTQQQQGLPQQLGEQGEQQGEQREERKQGGAAEAEMKMQAKAEKRAAKEQQKEREGAEKAARKAEKAEHKLRKEAEKARAGAVASGGGGGMGAWDLPGVHHPSELAYPTAMAVELPADTSGGSVDDEKLSWLLGQLLH